MYCDYKISLIKDLGNRVEVIGYLSEGDYQNTALENEPEKIEYVRTNRLGQVRLLFEKCPVSDDEINRELKRALEDIKGNREIISECL